MAKWGLGGPLWVCYIPFSHIIRVKASEDQIMCIELLEIEMSIKHSNILLYYQLFPFDSKSQKK